MKKIAMLLVVSLSLQLIAPMQVQGAEWSYGNNLAEASENENSQNEIFIEEQSKENETDNEMLGETEISNEEGSEESEASKEEPRESGTAEQEGYRESETSTEEIVMSEAGNESESSTENERVSEEESEAEITQADIEDSLKSDAAISDATEIEGLIQEKYYRCESGYQLFIGASMPEWNESITELTNVAYQLDSNELTVLGTVTTDNFAYYKSSSSYAGGCLTILINDVSADEGEHSVIIYFTVDGNSYQVSGATEFVDEISSDEGTVWEWSNKTEYISNRAGTSIEMLHASGYTFNQDEIWTQLQLVPTGTNNAIVTSTASGHGSNYVSTSRYSLSYKGEDGLYYNLSSKLIPTEYCIGGSFNDITLINNIDEGYYDMLVFTTEGRRYRKKNAYYASGKPIVYDIGHQYYKCEGEDNLFASDDTGDYVSVFVYGLNLDRNTVPTFYDTNNNEVLARYIEGDSECGYEYGNKWGNFYRLKKFSADLGVDQSTKCHAVVSDNAIYTNGEEYVDANIICYDIFFEEFFEHGQLYDDSPGRLRMYIGDKAECAIGDTLTYTLGKYGSFGNISEYTETAVVKSNGNGKYIEFSEESDIYKNIKNEWTYKVIKDGTDSNISKDRFAKIADIQTDWKLEVPAGGSWEIHAIGEITNTICNGNNASNSAVRLSLDKSNISNLAQYGTVRICIYNADGVACERKLVYFSGEEEGDEPGDEPAESAIVELKDGESAIYVYDVATNSPISGAVVAIESISGTTGSDGIVSLNISNEESKRLITVSASGYNGVKTYQTIRNKNLLRIGMEAVNNRIQILSATATLQDQDYDVLREKLVLGYAESMDDFSNIKEGTLKLKIESNKDNVKYEIFSEDTHFLDNVSLSQNNTESDAGDGSGGGGGGGGGGAFGEDDPMYQCNNSGEFEIAVAIETVKLGNREVAQTAVISTLEPGNRMYVRATDANGFFYIKELNISTTHNYLTQENTKQKGSFKLGDELRVSLPEDIPLIGGNEYVFGFGDEMPIEVEIDEDGLVKVAYNKPADVDMDKFNKYYKDLDKKADRVAKLNSNIAGVKKFSAGMIDVQGKVCGYGEGNISELKQGTITIKVGVIAELEGSAGYKQYWVIGFIPVNLYVEGSVKGSVGVESKLKIENWEIKDFELINGSFNVTVKLEAGAGVGFGYEIDASVIGEISYVNKPKRRYQKLWLDCYGKVKRTILGHFEKTLWESSKYEYTLFESGKDDQDAKAVGMDIQESDNGYVVSSRNYLKYTDGYHKSAQTNLLRLNSTEVSEAENKVIKVAVLPSASPRLVDVNGVKYLFWIDDVTSRDDYNRAALMYTKSSDGVVWDMPKRLISETEDSTLDGSYDVYVQDKKIYIVWQDESRQILKEDSLTDILKSLSVRYVIFDTTQDSVVENKCITNETGYYMYPCTVAAGDEHYWAYVHNMLDSGDVDGNNTHHLYCLSAKNNDTKEVDLPDKSQIVNMDAGIFSGDPYLVCELDMDGSINTVSDREIYLYNIKNSELSRLTNNNDIDTMPVISDSEKIYWFRNNDLVCLEDEGKTEKNIWNEQQLSYQTVFSVATDSSGRDTIIWEACDSQSEDGSVTIFQTSENDDGSWGNVVRFAKTTGTIASRVSAAGSGENLQVAHTEGIFLQDGTALKDLCVTKRENVVDIAVIGVDFDEESAYAGNQLTLKTEVVNNGNNVVDTIDVSVNDTVIATLTGLNLKPAECRKLDITGFRVPDDIRKSTYYTLKLTTQGETNQENNTADFLLGCPDIYVETNCRISEGRTWLDINLLNNTMYETSGKVLVHKSAENGEVIFGKDYDALGADNGYAYSVDLGDYESEEVKYYVEVTSANEENSLGNNIQFVYIGYGTGIEAEDDSQDIQEINSISLDKESLSLAIGKTAKLSVMDDKGTIVENSSVLWHSKVNPFVKTLFTKN